MVQKLYYPECHVFLYICAVPQEDKYNEYGNL